MKLSEWWLTRLRGSSRCGAPRLANGLSLEKQYNSLREPGRNPLRVLQEDELDAAVAVAYRVQPRR